MSENLVIVESPAKAKTIEGFLGKDFTVKSSYGHVRDLAKGDKAVNVENNFEPTYEVSEDKKSLINELLKHVKTAKVVWLATDEDREGEAISWHLYETLGLKNKETKRIVFHEITKGAIQNAIQNPRSIDYKLVDAQQARRILDRLVGFELSPVLWKKIKPSLSAGRVQSVAVRLIVEREREIEGHNSISSYKVVANFSVKDARGNDVSMKADLPQRFKTKDEAEAFLNRCKNADYNIANLETKPGKKTPAAPFTTSTLQQEASRKLGFSVSQTMRVAQNLYEAGKITYMRTDSVNLSQTAIDAAKAEIEKSYGKEFAFTRQYKTKNASAQEAHEAIRPTYFENPTTEGDSAERRLYELIWKRSIASQMSDAVFERTIATIAISTTTENFIATGEVIKFEGFLKVYLEGKDEDSEEDENSGLLPPLTVGQKLNLDNISATERFTYPPARYTEASLVKKLEELGIGRPSTYAPTISTVQQRGYVLKEERQGRERAFQLLILKSNQLTAQTKTEITGAEKNKLFPTDIGTVVTDFLVKNFDDVLDYSFTARVEKEFDEIAEGQLKWQDMLAEFYHPFHKDVVSTSETAERASGERVLGLDPVSKKQVSVRIARFGPVAQLGGTAEEDKAQYASLRAGQRLETITLEEALELFKLPRILGEYESKDIKIAIGRFGPYAQHNSAFYSLPKGEDPYTINYERAVEIILAKRKADSEKLIKIFPENEEAKVLNGRWGPYVAFGKKNLKIPKGQDPNSITYEEVLRINEATPDTPKRGRFGRAAVAADKAPAIKKAAPRKKAAKK
ncbi:MAG: type I DNA topoisomerase [Bacteroidia bacterium]